jgi:hypothetical protein
MCRTRTPSRAGRSPCRSEPSIESRKRNTPSWRRNCNSPVTASSLTVTLHPLPAGRHPLSRLTGDLPGGLPKSPRKTSANSGIDHRESLQTGHFRDPPGSRGCASSPEFRRTAASSGLGHESLASAGVGPDRPIELIRSRRRLIRTRGRVILRSAGSIRRAGSPYCASTGRLAFPQTWALLVYANVLVR